MNEKENTEIIAKIIERADDMKLLLFDRLSLAMDLEYVTDIFDLRLEDLLNADDYNFTHDICGIQNNFNRRTFKMENRFVPRYASNL